VDLQITNLGNVRGSGGFTLSVGLSTDPQFDQSDTLLKGLSRNFKLNPGQTKTVKFKFTMPELTAGSYSLLGVVDGSFLDSDLGNNIAVGPTPVTVQ